MPLNIVLSPDGRYAITTSSCLNALLSTLRVSDGAVVSSLAFPADNSSIPNGGLFYGLVFDPTPHNNTYTLYAAQGAYGTVAVLTLGSDGTLTQTGTIPAASSRPNPYMPLDQPAGIAFADGTIFMANYFSVNLSANYQPASTLSMYNASDGIRLGNYTFMDEANTNTPSFPYAVVAKSDGTRAYVASQRDGCVYVLDTTDPGHISLVSKIPNLADPSALLLNKAQTLLYIANAGSDTISVVNVANDQLQVIATVLLRPSNVINLPGVSPSGLALSPDEKTLFASLGDFNAAGIIDTGTNRLSGYIPVGWYPTALAATPDGKALLVVNGWGTTAMNPNPQLDYLNPDVLGINFSTQIPSWAAPPGPGYVLNSIPGNVSRIDLTKAIPTLAQSTAQVIQNNQNTPAMGSSADSTLEDIGIKSGKIKHVIYVIKENRGYDQVFGDLPQGNGFLSDHLRTGDYPEPARTGRALHPAGQFLQQCPGER
jgi:YVTN family beta-propeller protein